MNNIEALKEQLRQGEVKFQFTKKNGEIRDARGTLNMDIIPQENHPKGTSKEVPENTTRYFDLDKESWRSFTNDSFIGIVE